jgi:hypothetical protein
MLDDTTQDDTTHDWDADDDDVPDSIQRELDDRQTSVTLNMEEEADATFDMEKDANAKVDIGPVGTVDGIDGYIRG